MLAITSVAMFTFGSPAMFSHLIAECFGKVCLNRPALPDVQTLEAAGVSVALAAGYLTAIEAVFAAVHVLIATVIFWRRPDDRMALLSATALLLSGVSLWVNTPKALADAYPVLQLPVVVLGVCGGAAWALFLCSFPDGRVAPRWILIPAALWVISNAMLFYVPEAGNWDWMTPLWTLFSAAFVLSVIGAQVYRYRRLSGAIQRQQAKWAVAGIVAGMGSMGASILFIVLIGNPAGWHLAAFSVFAIGVFYAVLLFVPVSFAIAILRYRLWDIDLVIRRTLQYALLTGLLALTYFGGVVLLQAILGPLTGAANSPLVTVITTLAIAALFFPLRRRVQAFIDRRFYRAKYDAEQALAQFAATAREEVDMDRLAGALLSVVEETMQPERVGLWLKPTQAGARRSDA